MTIKMYLLDTLVVNTYLDMYVLYNKVQKILNTLFLTIFVPNRPVSQIPVDFLKSRSAGVRV